MAFMGNNSMFGHYMLPGNNPVTSSFGKSHGSGGFGSSHHGHGSGGFGQDGHGHEEHGHQIEHGIFSHQKSLLSNMTRSKDDHSSPWIYTSLSYPHGYHQSGASCLYDKPLEKEIKKEKLIRQQSVSSGDSPHEYKRAPSFRSNPEKMRSRTIGGIGGTTSAENYGRRTLRRSLSIVDDDQAPMNMDLARPELKRRHSIAVEKAIRRSNSVSKPRKPILPLNGLVSRMSRRKRSTKSSLSDRDSKVSNSESPSLTTTPYTGRSRSNTSDSQRSNASSSRRNTLDSQNSSNHTQNVLDHRNNSNTPSENETEKIILSLLNPEIVEDNVFNSQSDIDVITDNPTLTKTDSGNLKTEPNSLEHIIESPTLVSKRVHDLLPHEHDTASLHSLTSGRFTPRSVRSVSSGKSSRSSRRSQSPTRSSSSRNSNHKTKTSHNKLHNNRIDGKLIMYADPSDSDVSDIYYDCPTNEGNGNSGSSVPLYNGNSLIPKRGRRRQTKRPRISSTSTYTDEDDTTSTCDSVTHNPRSFHPVNQKYNKDYMDEVESDATPNENDDHLMTEGNNYETLPLRGIVNNANENEPRVHDKHTSSARSRPVLRKLANSQTYSLPADERNIESALEKDYIDPHGNGLHVIPTPSQNVEPYKDSYNLAIERQPELIVPIYVQELKAESDNKDSHGNETGTADSSESGYATSHIHQLSPRDYDKVSHFVNSLPYNPDMEERQSESSHGDVVMNGSETDSDVDGDFDDNYLPTSELSYVVCRSGSDSEGLPSDNDSDMSVSKLEVMKILESPTDVKVRIDHEMAMKSEKNSQNNSPRIGENEILKPISNLKKGSNSSETELLHIFKTEKDDIKEEPLNSPAGEIKSILVTAHGENASTTTTHLARGEMGRSVNSFNGRFLDRPFLSFRSEYSAQYETKLTKFIDLVLHVLNVLLFLSSAGVIAVGLWLLLKDFNVNHVTEILGNNLMQVIVYVSISGASIALLAAFCLCCGIRKDKVGLGFYAFVLVAVIIAFTTAAVLSAIFADKLNGVEFRFDFKDQLIEKYGVISGNAIENDFFTLSWDSMHEEFECCGAEGNTSESWAVFRRSKWYREQPFKATIFVPESCCIKNRNIEVCQGIDHNLFGPPVYTPNLGEHYRHVNPNLNTEGCYDLFTSYLANLTTLTAVTMGGLAGLYFLVVMLTWVFCFKKGQEYDDSYYDDSEYEMEEHDDEVFPEHSKPTEENKSSINTERKNSKGDINLKSGNNNNSKSDIEETVFMSTPIVSVHNAPATAANTSDKGKDTFVLEMERHRQNVPHDNGGLGGNYQYHYQDLDDNSDSNSDSDSESADRRDRWLTSRGAGHLLSTAIEEEDSNFEDSQDEDSRANSAFV